MELLALALSLSVSHELAGLLGSSLGMWPCFHSMTLQFQPGNLETVWNRVPSQSGDQWVQLQSNAVGLWADNLEFIFWNHYCIPQREQFSKRNCEYFIGWKYNIQLYSFWGRCLKQNKTPWCPKIKTTLVSLLYIATPCINIGNLISGEFHFQKSGLAHIKMPFQNRNITHLLKLRLSCFVLKAVKKETVALFIFSRHL